MNIAAMLALLEEQLDSYTLDETLERLYSYGNEGPTLEEFRCAGVEIFSHEGYFYQQEVEYSHIEGECCNDEVFFDTNGTYFELAA